MPWFKLTIETPTRDVSLGWSVLVGGRDEMRFQTVAVMHIQVL